MLEDPSTEELVTLPIFPLAIISLTLATVGSDRDCSPTMVWRLFSRARAVKASASFADAPRGHSTNTFFLRKRAGSARKKCLVTTTLTTTRSTVGSSAMACGLPYALVDAGRLCISIARRADSADELQ